MKTFICATCGTSFPSSEVPPEACLICEDERQYVPAGGQTWTTMDGIARDHENRVESLEPGLFGIGTEPRFAIGQRALLVQTPAGNVLWDCISLLGEDTIRRVEALGGIHDIAISHPHYYSSMVRWARTFDAPIRLHAADRPWVMDPDPLIEFWEGEELRLPGGLTLHRLGGHFEGGQILHWPEGAGGSGALLTGDIVQVVADLRWVSFMYSYPNYIPLPASEVRRIGRILDTLSFDRIYGAWWGKVVDSNARNVVRNSVTRYLAALQEPLHSRRARGPAHSHHPHPRETTG